MSVFEVVVATLCLTYSIGLDVGSPRHVNWSVTVNGR